MNDDPRTDRVNRREFFESLWRVDMLAMTLKPRPAA
jgi:hypothetical protein